MHSMFLKKVTCFIPIFFSCKDTSANSYSLQVELSAIKAGEKIILKNVFYETGKYDLKDESFAELNKAVAFLKKNKNISIEISGHTDNTGESKSNLLLSEKRAASVYNYLIKEGIESSRLTSKGYGEDKPVASNNTELGRAKNRRTEMMITLVK